MPSFKYDDTPRKPYEEPGEYHVTVEGAEWKISSNGNKMISIKLRTDGGALVFDNLVFSEKAFWKPSSAFRAFFPSKGIPAPKKGDDIDYEEKLDWLEEHLIGGNGWVRLTKGQTTTGKTRNEVEEYLPPKKGDPLAPPTTKTEPTGTPTSATTTKSAPAPKKKFPDPDDDEIPF